MFGPARSSSSAPLPRECTFSEARWHALARQWHPVALATELTSRPHGAVVLDQRVVVWAIGARVSAAQDLCIHRGAQISGGSILGEELVCPYHGFRYAASGACTLAPCTGSPDTPLPAKLHLRTYAAAAESGVIWVRLAPDGPASPPNLQAPRESAGAPAPQGWQTSAQRAVERLLDLGRGSAGWRVELQGPFSGTVSVDRPEPGRTMFAVQPTSTARCRIYLAGAAAAEIAHLLDAARPVVESQPPDAGADSEFFLPEDRAIVAYRQSLAALDLA